MVVKAKYIFIFEKKRLFDQPKALDIKETVDPGKALNIFFFQRMRTHAVDYSKTVDFIKFSMPDSNEACTVAYKCKYSFNMHGARVLNIKLTMIREIMNLF